MDNIDARVARAEDLGAMIIEPPNDVANVGRVAVLRDPTGATIGWMTSAED